MDLLNESTWPDFFLKGSAAPFLGRIRARVVVVAGGWGRGGGRGSSYLSNYPREEVGKKERTDSRVNGGALYGWTRSLHRGTGLGGLKGPRPTGQAEMCAWKSSVTLPC